MAPPDTPLTRSDRWLGRWGTLVLLMAAYFCAGHLGLKAPVVGNQVTLIWPPTGIATAAVLLLGFRAWPALALASLLTTIATGAPVAFALVTALGNPLQAVVARVLLYRAGSFDPSLRRVSDVALLVLLGAGISPIVSATIGTAGLCLTGVAPWAAYPTIWPVWWVGDGMGVLLVAPLLLTAISRRSPDHARRSVEGAILLLCLLIVGAGIYGGLAKPAVADPLSFLGFPLVIWAAVRFGPRGAAGAIVILAAAAVWGVTVGNGPFAQSKFSASLFYLHSFLSALAAVGLVLAAALEERAASRTALQAAHDALERRVEERTAALTDTNAALRSEIIGRRHIENELHETERRLRRILESTTDSVYVLNREWRFTYLNERANALLSQGRELLGVSIWDSFPDAVGGPFWHGFRRAMTDRVPTSFETFYPRLENWFEVHAYPSEDGIAVFFRNSTERKQAEQALRRSEGHLARAQRAAAIGTWEWDAVSGAVLWSDETFRLFGVSPDTFKPTRDALLSLLPKEEREAVRRIDDMVLRGKVPTDIAMDLPVALSDGTTRMLRREGAAVLDAEGRPVGLIGTIQDVTAKRQTEARLRESEERYRLAARAAGCVIWDWDPKTNRSEWVGPVEACFGYAAKTVEPTRQWWVERLHPADRDSVIRSLKAACEMGAEFWKKQYRFRRVDGSYAFVHDRAYTMYNAAGEPVRMIGAMQDITRRKKMEQELRRSEAHLVRAQHVASLGSFEYDVRSGELRWSDETYRIYGVARESFTPTLESVLSRLHSDDRNAVRSPAEMVDQGRRPPLSELSCEFRVVRPDGEVRILHRECDLVFDAAAKIISVVGTVQDVTETRAAERQHRDLEAQLLHAQKIEALGTLAGGIAHDLNNTLVPVVALSKLVQAKLPKDSREHKNLEIIRGAGARARDLVRQILAFSRKEEPKTEAVDLAALVDDGVAMLRATIPATIRIELTADEVPPVLADPSQLHQVLINLVMNAAQAIGNEMGTIGVVISHDRAEGRHVRLSVNDTGCGMDEATRQRIFDPFFTTKPAGEGTGLGLSVVHGIVTNHGGTVEVTSAPGQGTHFDIDFPLPEAPVSSVEDDRLAG